MVLRVHLKIFQAESTQSLEASTSMLKTHTEAKLKAWMSFKLYVDDKMVGQKGDS